MFRRALAVALLSLALPAMLLAGLGMWRGRPFGLAVAPVLLGFSVLMAASVGGLIVAMYWLGESYYVTQNYETALETFSGLIRRYPEGEKTADAELKIGYCLYELGRYGEAETALSGVIQRYPDSTVARLAESRLRALALERR